MNPDSISIDDIAGMVEPIEPPEGTIEDSSEDIGEGTVPGASEVSIDDIAGMVEGGGGAEEPINDSEYADLGVIEAGGRGLVKGAVALPKLTYQAGKRVIDYAQDPSLAVQDVSNIGQAVGQAVSEDPAGTAESFFHNTGRIASAIAGGTVLGPIGAVGGAAAFEGVLSFAEWLTGEDIQTKNLSQIVGETGEDIGSLGTGQAISSATKYGSAVRQGQSGIQRAAAKQAQRIKVRRSPSDSLKLLFSKHGSGIEAEQIEKAVKDGFDRFVDHGTALKLKGALPAAKEGTVFETISNVINTKSTKTGVSLLDQVGQEVRGSIAQVKKAYSVKDAKRFFQDATSSKFGQKTLDTFDDMRSKAMEPFLIRAGKKAGYDASAIRFVRSAQSSAGELASRIKTLTKQVELDDALARAGKAPSGSVANVKATSRLSELQNLQSQYSAAKKNIEEFTSAISEVELSPNEFWEATSDAVSIKWGNDFKDDASKLFGAFREGVQDDFRAHLDDVGLAAYNKANSQYSALKVFDEIANGARKAEFGAIKRPALIRDSFAKIKNIIAPVAETVAIDDFKAIERAFYGGDAGAGRAEKFFRYISQGGLPTAGRKLKAVSDFFNPVNTAAFTRTLLATEEYTKMNPEDMQSENQKITGTIENFRNGVQKIVMATQAGIGQPEATQRRIMKQLVSDPYAKPFISLDSNSGLLEGIQSIGGVPLSRSDAEKYFTNLSNSNLNSIERARRRRHFNSTGSFMPESPEEEIPKVDEAALERQIQIEKARRDVKKYRSSSDVIKHSNDALTKPRSVVSGFQPTSFNTMTTDYFDDAYQITRASEGGYSNHPKDKGGPTNMGVTQKTYNSFLRARGESARDVRDLTEDEAREIYRGFWEDSGAPQLPWPLSAVVFDAAINSGPARAKKQLQRILGVKEDGVIGDETLNAVESRNIMSVADRFLSERESFYKQQGQPEFEKGWLARVAKMRKLIGKERNKDLRVA